MPRVIAICGTAPVDRLEVNKEPPEVERWCQSACWKFVEQIDRYFELHTNSWIYGRSGPRGYVDFLYWMQHAKCPIYRQAVAPHIPNSVAYPLEEMVQKFGLPDGQTGELAGFFTSSIAYMLAMAVAELEKTGGEIKLFGVHMATKMEYSHQRNGCEYYLGWAKALGIKVTIPGNSPILKGAMYGHTEDSRMTIELVEKRIQEIDNQIRTEEAKVIDLRAKRAECDYWLNVINGLGGPDKMPQGRAVVLGKNGEVPTMILEQTRG